MCFSSSSVRALQRKVSFLFLSLFFILILGVGPIMATSPGEKNFDKPVSLAWVPDDQSLWAVTHHGSNVLRLDPDSKSVKVVFQSEGPLCDLHLIPGTSRLIALQYKPGRAFIFEGASSTTAPDISTVDLPDHAVDITSSHHGKYLYVLHHWNHRVSIMERSDADGALSSSQYKLKSEVKLPFAPWNQIILPDSKTWVITSAFAGKMCILNLQTGRIQKTLKSPVHNIRDLALSPDQSTLWMAHQLLHPDATTLRGDIQWGFLMENKVSGFPVNDLAVRFTHQNAVQLMGQLERPGNAAGDPEAVLWTDHGELLVALAGVGEVAILYEDSTTSARLGVGRRPCSIAYDPEHRRAFVANSLSDSVSIIHLAPKPRTTGTIRLGPRKKMNQIARGERLFYDAHQSFHGWFSCHSCHTEGHANGRLNDNAADGGFGAPKKVLSLLGVVDTAPWSWLGERNDLMHSIHESIETTMGEVSTREKTEALHAFMKTLTPAPALRKSLTELERAKGMTIFEKLRCDECHSPPHFTDPESYDVGLTDEVGHTHFNPPSLLGVSQRTQWLHDGRAKSLRSVFEEHRHMIREDLSDLDLRNLLRFLESL